MFSVCQPPPSMHANRCDSCGQLLLVPPDEFIPDLLQCNF